MAKPYSLSTERLNLSLPAAKDIPQIVDYARDPDIAENLSFFPYPYVEGDAIYWINMANQGSQKGNQYIFALRLKEDDSFLGGIELCLTPHFNRAELGYWLGKPHWGKGYATEAAREMVRFGFETLGLNKVTCSHYTFNPASGNVMQKCGMLKEGLLREQVKSGDTYHDLVVYGITRKQYEKKETLPSSNE